MKAKDVTFGRVYMVKVARFPPRKAIVLREPDRPYWECRDVDTGVTFRAYQDEFKSEVKGRHS